MAELPKVVDDDYDGPWVAATVECPICNTVHVSVHPVVCERVECPGCGYMIEAPPVDGVDAG